MAKSQGLTENILKHLRRLADAVQTPVNLTRVRRERHYLDAALAKLLAETPKPYPQTPFNEHGEAPENIISGEYRAPISGVESE